MNNSLERRLPLMISGLLAVSIAVFGFLAFTEVRNSSASAAVEQLRTVIAQTADALARSTAQRFDVLTHTASAPEVTAVFDAKTVAAQDLSASTFLRTRRALADSAVLVSQLLVRPDSSTRLSLAETPSSTEAAMLASTIADVSKRDSAAISPLFAAGTEMHYWLVVPSRNNGKTVGYLAEQRRLRTSPLLEQQIKDLTGQDYSIYFTAISGDVWTGLMGKPLAAKFDIKATKDTFQLAASDGQKIMGIKTRVRVTPWVLVLSITQEAVNRRSMAFLNRMLVIGLAILVVGLWVAWWLSRRVTRPLKSLTISAQAIANGDFARRENVRTSDEIGQLATAFNAMAERIGQSHTQLAGARVASDQARADAQRASQAKTDFLAMMSHELRTPLSAIAGYAEILQLGLHGTLTDKQHTDVERIQANQVHLLRIINDILDLTQVESGQMAVDLQPVSLRDVANDLEPIIMPLILGRNIKYHVNENVDGIVVLAERERLTQILVNLVANASRFTDAGSSITLHASSVNGRTYVHLTDAGVGIPFDKQELIFQPFVQLDGGPSRQAQGTGLGLAISRRIAEAMGGTLTVKSEIGMGATFTLELKGVPVAQSTQEDPSPISVSTEYESVAGQRTSFGRVAHVTANAVAFAFALVTLALFAPLKTASAQGLISAGIGVGGGVGDRNHNESGSGAHGLGFVQLHPPLLPVALRLDGLLTKISDGSTGISVIGNAVFIAPIPILQPYALLGFGKYGIGKDDSHTGVSGGVGARLKLPSIILFAEARRHQHISHDLLTVGIAL